MTLSSNRIYSKFHEMPIAKSTDFFTLLLYLLVYQQKFTQFLGITRKDVAVW